MLGNALEPQPSEFVDGTLKYLSWLTRMGWQRNFLNSANKGSVRTFCHECRVYPSVRNAKYAKAEEPGAEFTKGLNMILRLK